MLDNSKIKEYLQRREQEVWNDMKEAKELLGFNETYHAYKLEHEVFAEIMSDLEILTVEEESLLNNESPIIPIFPNTTDFWDKAHGIER